jgi:hypothetical protein
LVPGEYKIKVSLDIDHVMVDGIDDAVRLVIVESDYYGKGKIPINGLLALKHSWSVF